MRPPAAAASSLARACPITAPVQWRAGRAARRVARLALAAALLLLFAAPPPARAASPSSAQVGVRLGEHPGFARVVFDLPPGSIPGVEVTPGHVLVQFPAGTRIAPANWLPPRVLAFTASDGRADIRVPPGVEVVQTWPDGRLVLDIRASHAVSADDGAGVSPPAEMPAAETAPESPPAPRPPASPPAAARGRPRPDHRRITVPPSAAATPPADTPAAPAADAAPPAGPRAGVPATPPPATQPPVARTLAAPVPAAPSRAAPATAVRPAAPATAARPAAAAARPAVPAVAASSAVHPAAPAAPLAAVPKPAAPAPGIEAPTPGAPDVLPPAAGPRHAPSAVPAPVVAAAPRPGSLTPVIAEPLATPAPARAAPVSLRVTALPPGADGMPGLAVPFDQHIAAAAFRRGPYAVVVFDQARPIDLAGLPADPAFSDASVTVLPAATVIRLPLAAGQGLALAPAGERWTIRFTPLAIPPHPISPRLTDGRLLFTLDSPGGVVAVPDPDTGALLLVGTQRKPGQGIAAPRRTPGFTLLPSWQGVALEPFADTLTLQTMPGGFALAASDGLSLMPQAGADAAADAALLTRRFDFPALPQAALLRRLRAQLQSSATAPQLARAPLRRLAAQTLLSLGMGAEAQGMLDLAAVDDPRAADDPDHIGLSAIAALLAGRLTETEGLEDPRLGGTDEIALWRAARIAQQQRANDQPSPDAAATFAATVPLALAYPAPLRARLLPLIAETMALGNQGAAAKALLAKTALTEPGLGLARAMLAQAQGETAAALAAYDQLAAGNDRLVSARAATRAIELRLANRELDAAGAAAALEKQLYRWRGDSREYALRLRLAELRAQSGQWRGAFVLLRETAATFPEDPAPLAHEKAYFAEFLDGDPGQHLAPLDFVAFVDENADLMPDGPAGDALADRLADRLTQLDLPTRAGSVLQKLIDHARSPAARAALGVRLAELRLGNEDAGGARAALAATDAPGLPDPLVERRALVAARAASRQGEVGPAIAALDPLSSPAALSARAQILEDNKDWPRAVAALSDLVAQAVPAEGKLEEPQRRLLLRFASAAAAAGDTAKLAQLRDQALPRFGTGADADMLRVLTEAPVTSVGDLARARAEEQSASSVASRLAQAAGAAEAARVATPAPAPAAAAPRGAEASAGKAPAPR